MFSGTFSMRPWHGLLLELMMLSRLCPTVSFKAAQKACISAWQLVGGKLQLRVTTIWLAREW
jgi:hypothetical protein